MFYKIIHGFGVEDYIQIEASELQKAYYCFLMKKDAVFSGGAIKGTQILEIKPDYHRAMNWNIGYKLGVDDYEELKRKGIDRKMTHFMLGEKEKVQYLIETNQPELLGKDFELPKLENKISDEVKALGDSKRIS